MKRFIPIMIAAASLAGALAATGSTAGSTWTVTPVANGLDSPRGLAAGPSGTLLVAESDAVMLSAGQAGGDPIAVTAKYATMLPFQYAGTKSSHARTAASQMALVGVRVRLLMVCHHLLPGAAPSRENA